jgi:hypothetical protein
MVTAKPHFSAPTPTAGTVSERGFPVTSGFFTARVDSGGEVAGGGGVLHWLLLAPDRDSDMPSEPPKLVNGSCLHCAGHFEFEESASGKTVACPHCGRETPLFSLSISFDTVPAAPPPAPPAAEPAPQPEQEITRYFGGGPVRLGDRVRHHEGFATVVFISNGEREAYLSGYEDYSGYEAGVVICDDDGETTVLREEDPDLEMVHH